MQNLRNIEVNTTLTDKIKTYIWIFFYIYFQVKSFSKELAQFNMPLHLMIYIRKYRTKIFSEWMFNVNIQVNGIVWQM